MIELLTGSQTMGYLLSVPGMVQLKTTNRKEYSVKDPFIGLKPLCEDLGASSADTWEFPDWVEEQLQHAECYDYVYSMYEIAVMYERVGMSLVSRRHARMP